MDNILELTMAAPNTLTVAFFGQKGLYGIKNLNGNEIPKELDQFWTHKHLAEQALRQHAEDQRNAAGKRKQTVQSVRQGADN